MTLPKLIVFDMDGVLIDSGVHHRAAWEALLAERGTLQALARRGEIPPEVYRALSAEVDRWLNGSPPDSGDGPAEGKH